MSLYQRFLWFFGFQEGDTISDMLARQKERLGWCWWFFPIITMVFTLAMLGFQVWLTIHTIKMKLKGG